VIIRLEPREIIAGCAVVVAVAFAFSQFVGARYERANAILTCVEQLRFAESVPEEVWDTDGDTYTAELAWCTRLVEGS